MIPQEAKEKYNGLFGIDGPAASFWLEREVSQKWMHGNTEPQREGRKKGKK